MPAGSAVKTIQLTPWHRPGRRRRGAHPRRGHLALVSRRAYRTLRRVLVIIGLIVLPLPAWALIALAVRLALRPLSARWPGWPRRSPCAGRRGSRLAPTRHRHRDRANRAGLRRDAWTSSKAPKPSARRAEERTRGFLVRRRGARAADADHRRSGGGRDLLHHSSRAGRRAAAAAGDLLIAGWRSAPAGFGQRPARRGPADARLTWTLDAALARRRRQRGGRTRARPVWLTDPCCHDHAHGGPDVIVSADPTKLTAIIPQPGRQRPARGRPVGQRRPHLGPAARQRSCIEIAVTPGRACRWPIGSGSSSAWSGWTAPDRPDSGGSGLGPAIARGYARAHGGDLTCEEPLLHLLPGVPGQPFGPGARFVPTLPVTAPS